MNFFNQNVIRNRDEIEAKNQILSTQHAFAMIDWGASGTLQKRRFSAQV